MRDAGDSDGAGVEKAPAPTEGKTVELRKSCDYCVKLKRACDGKNPCSLCSRRHKPCTRSARKKSGPAKGTKYAPRRKRSIIAEWADRATHGPREPMLPHAFLGGGGIGDSGGLGGSSRDGSSRGMGGGGGPFDRYHLPMSAAEEAAARTATAGRPPFYSSSSSSGRPSQQSHPGTGAAPTGSRRFGGEVPQPWTEDRSAAEQGRRLSASSSSGLPFPMAWYGSEGYEAPEAGGVGRGGGGGGGDGARDHRHLAPHLESPMGYAPTTAEALSRRAQQQHAPLPRDAWSASPLNAEGVAGERIAAGMEPSRRRTWEPPSSGGWASQPDPLLTPQAEGMALTYGRRVRLSPPFLPSRPLMRPGGESSYGAAGPSFREREAAGRPAERHGEIDPASSLPFFPPPREPADPTAGFSFHQAPNRASWRRQSYMAPWESPGGGGGGSGSGRNDPGVPQQYPQQPTFYDSSERPPSSWNSPGGGGGGGDYMRGRRYYDDFRGDLEEARQERRGGAGGGAGGWRVLPPHGGGGGAGVDAFRERERLEVPSFSRHHHQTMGRFRVGGGEEERGAEMPPGPPSPAAGAAARDGLDQQPHQMFARGGADSAYERAVGHTSWPSGGGGGADHIDVQYQRGRQEAMRQEWEMRGRGGGGGGVGAPFQWEEPARGEALPSTAFDPPAPQELRRREGESDRVAPPSSSIGALPAGRSSHAREESTEGRGSRPASGSPGEEQQR